MSQEGHAASRLPEDGLQGRAVGTPRSLWVKMKGRMVWGFFFLYTCHRSPYGATGGDVLAPHGSRGVGLLLLFRWDLQRESAKALEQEIQGIHRPARRLQCGAS